VQNIGRVAEYVEAFVERNGIDNVQRLGLAVEGDRLPEREPLERSLEGTVAIEIELLD
jgi:hypothetical protein